MENVENVEKLIQAISKSLISSIGQCNAQELANSAWAFGTFSKQIQSTNNGKRSNRFDNFFKVLGENSIQWFGYFNAQELSNFCWGFATAGVNNAEVFKVGNKDTDGFLLIRVSSSFSSMRCCQHLSPVLFYFLKTIFCFLQKTKGPRWN